MLTSPAARDLAPEARDRFAREALGRLQTLLPGPVADHARVRGAALADDHERVRAAAAGAPRVEVEPNLPADVVGLFVLLPRTRTHYGASQMRIAASLRAARKLSGRRS